MRPDARQPAADEPFRNRLQGERPGSGGGDAFDAGLGRGSYIFNPTIAGIEQADALLIIGSTPRKEAAVLNARIRKRWRTGQLKIGVIGANGSGKSSLAFDTIYAEGQRRYVESLSAYARQFLEQMEKPDVDLIEGL